MMTIGYGLLMGLIGCAVTIVGFFIAFLVINYNKKKEKQKLEKQKENKIHPYGDDTV